MGSPSLAVHNLDRDRSIASAVDDARTFGSRFRGLMGRSSLPVGSGMWFEGTNGIHMFFMRFPIDCLFLGRPGPDGSRIVVALRRALPPWRGIVWYVRGAHGVLELPAGVLAESGTIVGDRVRLEAIRAVGTAEYPS